MKMWALIAAVAVPGMALAVACGSSVSCPAGDMSVTIDGISGCEPNSTVTSGTGTVTSCPTGTMKVTIDGVVTCELNSTSTAGTQSTGTQTTGTQTTASTGSQTTASTGTQGTGGSQTTASTGTQGTGGSIGNGGSGAGGGDPVCSNPNAEVSQACITCVNNLSNSDPCIQSFVTACESDSGCVAYAQCTNGCFNATMPSTSASGAGGGSAACVAGDGQGTGGAASNCDTCCQTGNMAGLNTYVTDLVNACVCASGAPCASACAQ